MRKITLLVLSIFFITSSAIAQETTKKEEKQTQQGHIDQNKIQTNERCFGDSK